MIKYQVCISSNITQRRNTREERGRNQEQWERKQFVSLLLNMGSWRLLLLATGSNKSDFSVSRNRQAHGPELDNHFVLLQNGQIASPPLPEDSGMPIACDKVVVFKSKRSSNILKGLRGKEFCDVKGLICVFVCNTLPTSTLSNTSVKHHCIFLHHFYSHSLSLFF